jgi:hypothetical protein
MNSNISDLSDMFDFICRSFGVTIETNVDLHAIVIFDVFYEKTVSSDQIGLITTIKAISNLGVTSLDLLNDPDNIARNRQHVGDSAQ